MAARFGLGDNREYIFVVILGLFIGSIIGAMAQIVPYALVLFTGMGVAVLGWRQDGSVSIFVMMLGLLVGSLFGNMASVMPYGVTIFLAVVMIVMVWRTQGGGMQTSGPTSTIALILFIIVSVGFLWNGTYQDFCNPNFIAGFDACLNPQASGYITAWQGCVNSCAISPFTLFGNSPFAFLLNGDFIGFLQSLIKGGQSVIQIGGIFSVVGSLITFIVGAILLFLGSGIGLEATAATVGGTINENDAGTRTYQSLGLGLILWSLVTGLIFSGAWFQYIGFGIGSVGTPSSLGGPSTITINGIVTQLAAGGSLYVLFLMVYTYELYRQGKTITA